MSRPEDKYYSDLDVQLQQLAAVDWVRFVQLVGEENITAAKVCIMKSKGKSLTQISNKLAITRRQAQTRCDKC